MVFTINGKPLTLAQKFFAFVRNRERNNLHPVVVGVPKSTEGQYKS